MNFNYINLVNRSSRYESLHVRAMSARVYNDTWMNPFDDDRHVYNMRYTELSWTNFSQLAVI